tara:strand:- start:235 stop:825 length:591 start_codon:yes stop_codon:yes gene_type:complete
MVEIICPHCDQEIELPDDAHGEFECPLCTEVFEWEEPQISHEFERTKAGIVGLVVVVLFIIFVIVAVLHDNTKNWPVRQGEIIEISYEGRVVVGESAYHRVKIEADYGDGPTIADLECGSEEDAVAYVDNNNVGDTIDLRVNPESTHPFFVVDGGCPKQPASQLEIYGDLICFGVIVVVIAVNNVISWMRDEIRNK